MKKKHDKYRDTTTTFENVEPQVGNNPSPNRQLYSFSLNVLLFKRKLASILVKVTCFYSDGLNVQNFVNVLSTV